MAIQIGSYLFRKVLRVTALNISSKELYGSITRFNNVTFTNGQESTDITDQGTLMARLDYGKSASFNFETPLISDTLLALQAGTDIEHVENISDIAIPDTFIVNEDIGITKYGSNPGAVSGSEIRYAYLVDKNGSPYKTFTQAPVAGPGEFSYAPATRTLTFDAGEIPDGSKVLIYTYPVVKEAKVIVNDSNKFSKSATCYIDIQVGDICDDSREYLMRVEFENGKFSGSYEWSISGTDPASQSVEVASMLPCGESRLWKAYIFDEDDILVDVI
jgi:hypothetical protein